MRIRNLMFAATLSCAAVLGVAALCTTKSFAQEKTPTRAHAYLTDAQGKKVGVAALTATKGGVRIVVTVDGLTPGLHGIHIHTVGKCEGPAVASAGGHLNPDMKMHGKDNPMGAHAGDLLNITADAKGHAKATLVAAGSLMPGVGPISACAAITSTMPWNTPNQRNAD